MDRIPGGVLTVWSALAVQRTGILGRLGVFDEKVKVRGDVGDGIGSWK